MYGSLRNATQGAFVTGTEWGEQTNFHGKIHKCARRREVARSNKCCRSRSRAIKVSPAILAALAVAVSACGDTPTDRALAGGAVGAGTGAVVGSTAGRPDRRCSGRRDRYDGGYYR